MKISLQDAAAELQQYPEQLFIKLFAHGSMSVELYKPIDKDLQTPHQQDELYMIVSGTGELLIGNDRHVFVTGDVLFVPAGAKHHFENFSPDFATWVVFYGPNSGEQSL